MTKSPFTSLFKWGTYILLVLAAFTARAQEPFEITWDFNGNKKGVSNSANFLAQDASFAPQVLDNGYVAVNDTNQALIAQNWPALRDDNFYLQFELTPLVFKFDINSVFARLKRSANGPRQFAVTMTITKYNSFEDSLTTNVGTFSLPTEEFTTVRVEPVRTLNQHSTYKLRIYAFGATSVYEDLLFDYIKVQGDRTAVILPITLVYFKASVAGDRVDLRWETAMERNTKEFIIQRSGDLGEFIDIGKVDAVGNSYERQQYSFSDPAPISGINYYRLRTVDFDGTYEYSKPSDVIYRPDQPTLLVGPNPVTDNIIRLRTFGVTPSSLRLSTLLGQPVPIRINSLSGNEVELRPKSPLAAGVYLLTGDTESKPLTVKVLIQ